jgi:hypothetical protein
MYKLRISDKNYFIADFGYLFIPVPIQLLINRFVH